jgi:hypothetical protein
MPDMDAPVLNEDGTLKDVMEIEWINSPSDEHRTITITDQEKHKRTNSLTQSPTDDEDVQDGDMLPGLTNKGHAKKVDGKCVPNTHVSGFDPTIMDELKWHFCQDTWAS